MATAQVLARLEGLRSPFKYPYYNINKGKSNKKHYFLRVAAPGDSFLEFYQAPLLAAAPLHGR